MKRIIKDYLYFSKQERVAVIVLLALMGLFIALPYLYKPKTAPPVINQALLEWLAGKGDSSVSGMNSPLVNTAIKPAVASFPFDPNTASEADWVRLGIPEKTARTIRNYQSKGGRFRRPDDIRKIWGITKADADRLVPYVRIAGSADNNDLLKNSPQTAGQKTPKPIDINAADPVEWASLPGIGKIIANRIVRYRDKLGGFRSVEQVGKTYGISDSLFGQILPYLRYNEALLAKLNLNTASAYALRQAGLDYRLAATLVRFREQNGAYRSMEELHRVLEVPDSVWQKLILVIKIE